MALPTGAEAKVSKETQGESIKNEPYLRRGHVNFGPECLRHTAAIYRRDETYAREFGAEKAHEFIYPDRDISPHATFIIGLYKADPDNVQGIGIPNDEELLELDDLQVINLFDIQNRPILEARHYLFEQRAHLSFLDVIGVEQDRIYSSTGHNLKLKPRTLARPLLVGLIRESEDPDSKILQVGYRLSESN